MSDKDVKHAAVQDEGEIGSAKKRKLEASQTGADLKLTAAAESLSRIASSDLQSAGLDALESLFAATRALLEMRRKCISRILTLRCQRGVFSEMDFYYSDFVEPPGVPKGEVERCLKELQKKTVVVSEDLNATGPLSDFLHQDSGWERTISVAGVRITASCSSCTQTAADEKHYDEMSIHGHQSLASFRKALGMPHLPLGVLLHFITWCLEPEGGFDRDHRSWEMSGRSWHEEALGSWMRGAQEDFKGYIMDHDDTDEPVLDKELIISRLADRWVVVKARQLPFIQSCYDPLFAKYQKQYRKNPKAAILEFERGVAWPLIDMSSAATEKPAGIAKRQTYADNSRTAKNGPREACAIAPAPCPSPAPRGFEASLKIAEEASYMTAKSFARFCRIPSAL